MRPARDTKFKADPVQFGLVATLNRPARKFHQPVARSQRHQSRSVRGTNLTKRELVAQILREYERRGDAMRCLDSNGNIAWKATPRFLTKLADAERDAQDELEDLP